MGKSDNHRLLSWRDARDRVAERRGVLFFGLLRVKVKFGNKGLDSWIPQESFLRCHDLGIFLRCQKSALRFVFGGKLVFGRIFIWYHPGHFPRGFLLNLRTQTWICFFLIPLLCTMINQKNRWTTIWEHIFFLLCPSIWSKSTEAEKRSKFQISAPQGVCAFPRARQNCPIVGEQCIYIIFWNKLPKDGIWCYTLWFFPTHAARFRPFPGNTSLYIIYLDWSTSTGSSLGQMLVDQKSTLCLWVRYLAISLTFVFLF